MIGQKMKKLPIEIQTFEDLKEGINVSRQDKKDI
jgi:hypothetical protein